ncbi:hypothetical protein RDI58_024336 [Solanum bulbocastanum]
MNHCDVC